MRKTMCTFATTAVMVLGVGSVFAAPAPEAEIRPPRVEASVVTSTGETAAGIERAGIDRTMDDIRESAALVLLGGMLLGLAAAVRRTV